MSVKELVKEQNGVKMPKPLEEKGNRKASDAVGQPAVTVTNPIFVPTFKFGGSRNAAEWFLDRNGEMEVVTAEDNNLVLGIKKITAFGATAGQQAFGTIANVTLETVLGTVTGIQVRESSKNRGVLFIGTSSRKVEKEGQAVQYYNDIELNQATRAQILSWIHPQLNPNA
jgi:hypothetical protein